MDFNEPLHPAAGFIVYNLMMEYMDTFIYDYSRKKDGKEFPSLRVTTDMMLTFLKDMRDIDITTVIKKDIPADELINKLGNELAKLARQSDIFSSEEHGLFMEQPKPAEKPAKGKRKPPKVKEPPPEPFVLTHENDTTWLKSIGITIEQLSSKEKHD